MVSPRWVAPAARGLLLASTRDATPANYSQDTLAAADTLQDWYNSTLGLWETTGWWNSANCLTVLADFANLDSSASDTLNIQGIISNTFALVQGTITSATKVKTSTGLVHSSYTKSSMIGKEMIAEGSYPGFLDEYYDDEGWWALALIRSWDLTQDDSYLSAAEYIFEDMKNGTDDVCGGGIWWSKAKTYKNAIANELYLSVAASLANRIPAKASYYLDIAENEWTWFKGSGMINSNNNINDGLTIDANGTCVNNGETEWSYNQGVILGGLAQLAQASGDSSYLTEAGTLATAAIELLSDSNGVIHDVCEPDCGADGDQFKGIFMRNLGYLQAAAPQAAYQTSIINNADSIWANDRNTQNNQLGDVWSGPYNAGGDPTAATQSSAMDALVAAVGAA